MAIVISASAEMTTAWTGTHELGNWNWDTRLEIDASALTELQSGDKLVITMSQNIEDATAADEQWYQFQITANNPTLVEGTTDQYTRTTIAESSIDADGDVTIDLTDEQVELLQTYGMIINGHFITITKVAYGTEEAGGEEEPDTPDEEGTTTILWEEEPVETGDWATHLVLSYENKPVALGTAKVGDVITVSYTVAGEGAHVQVANPDGWVAFDTDSETDASSTSGDYKFRYEIPNVEILEKIQMNGILVRGKNIIITKVELTTYPDSYDAALVTIGTAGVATYSNSSKTLDFTGADIKAYYATAVETGKVTLSPVTIVPAYTGIIVKGDPGSYEIPVGEGTNETTNYLKAIGDWAQTVTASTEGTYHYTFSEDQNATFSLVSAEATVPAHKAYLETTTDITPAEGTIELVFTDDESTGISNIEVNKIEDDAYYNLQGMRVEHPSKGIYIHNGKKVIIR